MEIETLNSHAVGVWGKRIIIQNPPTPRESFSCLEMRAFAAWLVVLADSVEEYGGETSFEDILKAVRNT